MPKWTQHSIDQGAAETAGGEQKRMRAVRDRWMEEAEREDCEGGTDGAQKGDTSEEETVDREKRGTELTETSVCVVGGRNRGGKIRVKGPAYFGSLPGHLCYHAPRPAQRLICRGKKTSWSVLENRPGHAGSPHLSQQQSCRKATMKTPPNTIYPMLAHSVGCRNPYTGTKSKNT